MTNATADDIIKRLEDIMRGDVTVPLPDSSELKFAHKNLMQFYKFSGPKRGPSAGGSPTMKEIQWGERKASLPEPESFTVFLSERGGKRWFDVMWADNGIFIFSEKVVHDVATENITGINFYPVTLDGRWNKTLDMSAAPNYFWGDIVGRMPAKAFSSKGELYTFDEDNGYYLLPKGYDQSSYELETEQWDGSDFLQMSTVYNAIRFASERVVDAARKNKWTNFAFHELVDGYMYDPKQYMKPISSP